jgi:hypothetical protein
MFGAVDIKHPKLLPAFPGKSGSGTAAASGRKIKALCRTDGPYPERIGKAFGKPRISGYGSLANRLDCNAGWGDFANDSRVAAACRGKEREKITRRRRDAEVKQRRKIQESRLKPVIRAGGAA